MLRDFAARVFVKMVGFVFFWMVILFVIVLLLVMVVSFVSKVRFFFLFFVRDLFIGLGDG